MMFDYRNVWNSFFKHFMKWLLQIKMFLVSKLTSEKILQSQQEYLESLAKLSNILGLS